MKPAALPCRRPASAALRIAGVEPGSSDYPGIPMKFERSKWPTQSTSTPSTAAIASTCSSPRSVSIGDDHGARVRLGDLLADIAAEVVALSEAERRPAPADRWIAARLDDGTRLGGGFDHRDHHAARAEVERSCEPGVLASRHAHHRLDRQAAAGGEQPVQRLVAQAGVLHVVENELAARVGQDAGHARREEFEDHRAGNGLAGAKVVLDGVRCTDGPLPRPTRAKHSRLRVCKRESTSRVAASRARHPRSACRRTW